MAMPQVVSAVAAAAPKVYQKANDMAKKLSGGRSLTDLVIKPNGPALAGEILVKSGLPIGQLKGLMDGFDVHDSRAILAHAAKFVSGEVAAVSQAAVVVPDDGVSQSVRDDIVCIQIKEVITALGLRNVAELMKVATVLNTLTAEQVRIYKDKGVMHPRLGYN